MVKGNKWAKKDESDKWTQFQKLFPALTNLIDIYEKASVSAKNKLVEAVFKHHLVYSEGAFKTPSINDAFALNYLNANKKRAALCRTTLSLFRAKPLL